MTEENEIWQELLCFKSDPYYLGDCIQDALIDFDKLLQAEGFYNKESFHQLECKHKAVLTFLRNQ